MEQIDLSGCGSKKIVITDNAEFLAFKNIPKTATIKVTVQKEGFGDNVVIPSMTIDKVVELHKKVRAFNNKIDFVMLSKEVAVDGGTARAFTHTLIALAYDGEIELGDNDKIIVELGNLQSVTTDCIMKPIEGAAITNMFFNINKLTYTASKDEKQIDVTNVKFLAFDVVPSEIALFYKTEIKRVDEFTLTVDNVDKFGLVELKEGDDSPYVYGTAKMYLLDVTDVKTCVIKDEVQDNDFDILTIGNV